MRLIGIMLLHLTASTILVIITVLFHGTGLALFARILRKELREERLHHIPSFSLRSMFFTLGLVLALFVLHGIEIWLYAFFYLIVGAIGDLETAVYFSTISYAGIGYDDRYIVPAWRLVAAIEGINGLLLLGWSTAFFVTMITRFSR
ncbi:ion channel [Sphingorhabdus sp.]|uniref:ion channel n=2 Tax=Sphingorhabdus sp. TaxID=1902408 RepID=UPI0032B83117